MSELLRPRRLFPPALWGAAALLPALILPVALHGGRPGSRHTAALLPAASADPLASHPRFLLFRSPTSAMERRFLAGLSARDLDGVPQLDPQGREAQRFSVSESPTLLLLDDSGREVSRKTDPQEIKDELDSVHATCRAKRRPRLKWVEETDANARKVYRRFQRAQAPDIFKAMSLRPDLMEKMYDLSEEGHFSKGYLDEATKERIATVVSSLNRSPYCVHSHAEGLRDLGASKTEVDALSRGDLAGAGLSPKQRVLMEFAKRLTEKPAEISDEDIVKLRSEGWKDEQIFEAAFDTSLFALFNRVAATYGLEYSSEGWTR